MLRSEFEVLTGIYVDDEMMDVINERYMSFEGDKRVFCQAYKSNLNGLAQSIQQETNRRRFKSEADQEDDTKELEDRITELKAELDREKEWQPYQVSAMNTVDYAKLAAYCRKPLTKEAAAELVASEFGFAKENVVICNELPSFRKDRHGKIEQCGKEDRQPVYDATDYNYIRFNVKAKGTTFFWEMVNGELEAFKC